MARWESQNPIAQTTEAEQKQQEKNYLSKNRLFLLYVYTKF